MSMAYHIFSAILILVASILCMTWLFAVIGVHPAIGQILGIFLFVFFLYE